MESVFLKRLLEPLGYNREYFSQNYSVQMNGTSAVKFDYVVFSDKYLKDISTSCIAVKEVRSDEEENQYVEGAKYLAAPIAIISKDERIRIWGIASFENILLKDGEENIIYLYFEQNRFQFMPDSLIHAKMGYKQLDIFEVSGLIDFSREATCKILSEEFERGLTAAQNYIQKKRNVKKQDLNHITSITMHVISALIIHSKTTEVETIPDIFELIDDLSKKYKDYFSGELMMEYGEGLITEIYESLSKSINYQSVDHELLGYFYETTLLKFDEKKAKAARKKFGIYYTPRALSEEMVWSIPFECIPVDKRYVLDGTCGSGSLLLSACKRLEELVKYDRDDDECHRYLTEMIEGNDIDRFASEVARLSLLLYGLPYGNRWKIRTGDLLTIRKSGLRMPYIILGNPPYEEKNEKGRKEQKAMLFFDKYLEWICEGGYIGIILPQSFLQNESSTKQREKLLNEFDIIELWMLPGHIFENNCATVVVIAQKKKSFENLTKIKILTKNRGSVGDYFQKHKWDFEFFVQMQDCWKKEKDFKISVSPIEDILQKIIKDNRMLGDITYNITGIKYPKELERFETERDGCVPFLGDAKDFTKYVISSQIQENIKYIRYHISKEEEREINKDKDRLRLRRDYESVLKASEKVLVNMSSTPGKIDGNGACIDERGYYPSFSFFVFVTKDQRISNRVICMLINSKLVNMFLRRKCVKRTAVTSVLRSIPVPEFSDIQIRELERCYAEMKAAYFSNDRKGAGEIEEKADRIIFDAFELKPNERDQVKMSWSIYAGNKLNQNEGNADQKDYSYVTGEVLEIDTENMYCNVYFVEFGEQQVKIESSMPGWFLRTGAEFSAKYCGGNLMDIKPLVYSYLDDEEIMALSNSECSRSRGGER